MENKYMILKLNEKEIRALKSVLAEYVVNYIFEQGKPDYEEKVNKNFDEYSKKHRKSRYCENILNIIEYLERK